MVIDPLARIGDNGLIVQSGHPAALCAGPAASSSPFQVQEGRSYAAPVSLVSEKLPFLSAENREWMLEKTAASVFFT